MIFRRKGDMNLYSFLDARCIGRPCWSPGMFRSTATLSPCCMNRAYHGCPEGPEGEREETCCWCEGNGKERAKGSTEILNCRICGGNGKTITVGVPVYDEAKAKERKALGWRKA